MRKRNPDLTNRRKKTRCFKPAEIQNKRPLSQSTGLAQEDMCWSELILQKVVVIFVVVIFSLVVYMDTSD